MLSPHLLELLRNWWLVLRPKGYLFPGQDRINPLTTRHLHRICVEAARAAGITKRVSPHSLRHYVSFRTMSGDEAGFAKFICMWWILGALMLNDTRHSLLGITSY